MAGVGTAKKRQRVATASATASRASSTAAIIDGDSPAPHHKPPVLRRTSSSPSLLPPFFNDPSTADVILRLHPSPLPSSPSSSTSSSAAAVDSSSDEVQVYLHSNIILRQSKYFSALLSDRWNKKSSDDFHRLSLGFNRNSDSILTVLQLLYSNDFDGVIINVSIALSLLPVALELLFEDCVSFCVKFLEAVPWSEDEENKVIKLIPFLNEVESNELLARVVSAEKTSSEEMLHGLINTAIHVHSNTACVKAFVSKLLREFSSRESARRVLERAFEASLKVVKEAMEEYSSPNFRGDHNETEAIQRLNLHTAMTNGRHLLWLVERMVELRVGDLAVKQWSEEGAFTGDLQRAFRDDAWRNIVPGLPAVVLRCTFKLAIAVASGTILASRQVRMKLVKDWLPVLIVCKENVSPMFTTHKSLFMELEEVFLRIISTLPMSAAQDLLQQCLSFSTRNVDDCPHLITAFNTWFHRANRYLSAENLDC